MRGAARARLRPPARRRPDQPQLRSRPAHGESSHWPGPSRTPSSRRSDQPQKRAPAAEETLALLASLVSRRSPRLCNWQCPRSLPFVLARPAFWSLDHNKHPRNRYLAWEERLKRAACTRDLDLAATPAWCSRTRELIQL